MAKKPLTTRELIARAAKAVEGMPKWKTDGFDQRYRRFRRSKDIPWLVVYYSPGRWDGG